MAACCRSSLLLLCSLSCFLQVLAESQVFQSHGGAAVFLRSRRANSFLLEELLQGDLERECMEEHCNYEEAREYFEDDQKTINFWRNYKNRDQCQPNPCLYGGNCTNTLGGFLCSCPDHRHGNICELGTPDHVGRPTAAAQTEETEFSECPTDGPDACHQLCTASQRSFVCSCVPGFRLQDDGQSCLPEAEFPCGRLPEAFDDTASFCRRGNCPWQASVLHAARQAPLCAAVILGRFSVLTAARCLYPEPASEPKPSDFLVLAGDGRTPLPVRALYIHGRFEHGNHDNDLVLLELSRPLDFGPGLMHLCLPTRDFSENVLMHPGRLGVAAAAEEHVEQLSYLTLDECRDKLNVSHALSNKMFCMRRRPGASAPHRAPPAHGRQDGVRGSQGGVAHPRAAPGRHGPVLTETLNQTHGLHSHHGRSHSCGVLLPGTPVATAEKGTAFLTGLMMSSRCNREGGGGMVFTKLSRYLSWIKARLQVAEDHMIPQVTTFPGER